MATRKIEISYQSRERWQISGSAFSERVVCAVCRNDAEMLLIENLAMLTGVSQLEIFRAIERDELHFFESERSRLWVCPESFIKRS